MAISPEYWTYVIWDATTGSATARNVLRWRPGLYNPDYDPLNPGEEEPDGRPTDGGEYDSATEGWTAVADFPEEAPPAWDQDATPIQEAIYTVNTTTGVVTRTVANAPLARRKREVLRILNRRRQRLLGMTDLFSRASDTTVEAADTVIDNIDNVETTYAATLATNPEALLTEVGLIEPTPTLDSGGRHILRRLARFFDAGTILRGKLVTRATYDYAQAIGLGGYDSLTALTEVAKIDIGSINRGNIWVLATTFEAKNLSGQTTTVKLQYRYSFFGGVMSGWVDYRVWTGADFTTSYTDKAYAEFFPFPGDDIEFRVVYQCSSNLISNVLRNVYLTAVRLTVWET